MHCNNFKFQGTFGNSEIPSGTEYIFSQGTLYSRLGPISFTIYQIKCTNNECDLLPLKEAEKKGIFFLSTVTACGDEIAWDFTNAVLHSRISFTAFCNEMTRKYKTNNQTSGHFMSPNTFIAWYFAWVSALKIDFRKGVDPWCKYQPKVLACDGTHIGVSVRNQDLKNPVTAPDEKRLVAPKHKRYIKFNNQ